MKKAISLIGLLMTPAIPSGLLAQQARYSQTNLVSNTGGVPNTTDPQLFDPWGIFFNVNSFCSLYASGRRIPGFPIARLGLVWNYIDHLQEDAVCLQASCRNERVRLAASRFTIHSGMRRQQRQSNNAKAPVSSQTTLTVACTSGALSHSVPVSVTVN